MKKIVIKVGTNVITRDSGRLNHPVMRALVEQIAKLKRKKIDVILVSSGAVAAGRTRLKQGAGKKDTVESRQILSAVGQVKLMEIYAQLFRKEGYQCAQVLATKGDFRDRHHYLCMKDCFNALLHDDIIPIVNENDVVSVSELMFTDNDELAGLISAMLNVDGLLILTSVDGLYDRDPSDPEAQLIESIAVNDSSYKQFTTPNAPGSLFGRGGMHTKCRVAKKLADLGIRTHIINGRDPANVVRVVRGRNVGSTFEPKRRVSGVKTWIAHAEGQEKGVVTINKCAEDVLLDREKARSLLPVGIIKIHGDFEKGDIVRVETEDKRHFGYGVAQYGADTAKPLLGQKNQKPLIHYDYLVINI